MMAPARIAVVRRECLRPRNKLNGNGQRLLQSSLPANAVLTIAFKENLKAALLQSSFRGPRDGVHYALQVTFEHGYGTPLLRLCD